MSLCYRCEHRARFLENGLRPRYECGEIKQSKFACYMYRPVKPVVLKKFKDDKRPQWAPAMISARSEYVEIPEDGEIRFRNNKKGSLAFWFFPKQESKTIQENPIEDTLRKCEAASERAR